VALRASGFAHGRWDRRPFLWELVERVAQAGTQARPWKQRAQPLGRAVKAIGEDPFDAVRRLLLGGRALKRPIGLGQSGRTGVLRVPEMPEHATTDNRRQIDFVGQTVTVLLVGQELDGQGQPTPRQARHQTVVAERADEAIERHGGDMADDRGQLPTEATVRGHPGIARHVWVHLMIAQDEMRKDRADGFTPRTLNTPDGETAQPDPDIMRVTCQTPAPATGRLVFQLKAQGQHDGKDTLEKRLAVSQQAAVGGFVSNINGDGTVFSRRFGRCAHVSPLGHQVS
jgi:hypothetical protein